MASSQIIKCRASYSKLNNIECHQANISAFICDDTSSAAQVAADMVGQADLDPDAEIYVFHPNRSWHVYILHLAVHFHLLVLVRNTLCL